MPTARHRRWSVVQSVSTVRVMRPACCPCAAEVPSNTAGISNDLRSPANGHLGRWFRLVGTTWHKVVLLDLPEGDAKFAQPAVQRRAADPQLRHYRAVFQPWALQVVRNSARSSRSPRSTPPPLFANGGVSRPWRGGRSGGDPGCGTIRSLRLVEPWVRSVGGEARLSVVSLPSLRSK